MKVLKDFKQVNIIIIFSCVHCREWIRGERLEKRKAIQEEVATIWKGEGFCLDLDHNYRNKE